MAMIKIMMLIKNAKIIKLGGIFGESGQVD